MKADIGTASVYQIYPRSFKDSNGDGVGDLVGIIQELDYIAALGVEYVWITPFFFSPQNDNGYDISNYYQIDPIFGTMEDFETLMREAKKRGLKIMLDMVFNHTSTEHEWFQRALKGDARYQAYYIFQDGDPVHPPTNWRSKFGGSAWEYVPSLGKWYLHLFDVTQADLNWDNAEVRKELARVVLFWKSRGVEGFRFDVINLISKSAIFEDDTSGDGRKFYVDGPNVHTYLKELVASCDLDKLMTVGEMSSTSLEQCVQYSNPAEHELSMVFSFLHLKVDYKDPENKWELAEVDVAKLRHTLKTWQEGMQEKGGWNALFWCNHDQPRVVSRFGDEGILHDESAKTCALCMGLLRGTFYIYQGEELGMTNAHFTQLSQWRDVETLNAYYELCSQGMTSDDALYVLGQRSRDNGRTPMQWTEEKFAGFTAGVPWIDLAKSTKDCCQDRICVTREENDPSSVLACYRRVIELRKTCEVISKGYVTFLDEAALPIISYVRFGSLCPGGSCDIPAGASLHAKSFEAGSILVAANFSDKTVPVGDETYALLTGGTWDVLLASYEAVRLEDVLRRGLRPFEGIACIKTASTPASSTSLC